MAYKFSNESEAIKALHTPRDHDERWDAGAYLREIASEAAIPIMAGMLMAQIDRGVAEAVREAKARIAADPQLRDIAAQTRSRQTAFSI